MRVRCAVAFLVFVLKALSARFADAQAVRGTVLGTITDKTGGILPGVTVTVTNTETGVMQNTVSDAQACYSVTNLLPGMYSVESSGGFQNVIREAFASSSARRCRSTSRSGRRRSRKR